MKNKFIDQIVNNIRLVQNLIYVLRTQIIYNSTVKFSKYVIILILLVGVVTIGYNQICRQILLFFQ